MTSHTSSEQQEQDSVPSQSKKSDETCALCPSLQALEEFAKKKYALYRGVAQRDDDAQESYDPVATNFLHASQLMVQAVLRSTQKELERA